MSPDMGIKKVDDIDGNHLNADDCTPRMEDHYNEHLSTKLHAVLNLANPDINTTCNSVGKKVDKKKTNKSLIETFKSRFQPAKKRSQQFIQKKSDKLNIDDSDSYANKSRTIECFNPSHLGFKGTHIIFTCNICGAVLRSKGNLIAHQVTHSVERPYACDKCDLKFKLKSHLNAHTRNVHYNEKNHICEECNKGFFSLAQWKIHMYSHNKKYPHSCADCGNKFSQKSHLREHMRRHLGIRDVKCPHCLYTTSSRNSLNTHLKGVHNDDKRYMCNECGLRFLYPSSLKKHFTIHSGEKNFRCVDCNKNFRTVNACKEHMRIHTKEKPYSCCVIL